MPRGAQRKHENVANSGCLRVSQILVNKASGDSVFEVLGNKSTRKLPNRPSFTHVQGPNLETFSRSPSGIEIFQARLKRMTLASEIEHFKRATHRTPNFVGGILKVKTEHFKRD